MALLSPFVPVLAWFSNPAMLWGLGAASIPLVIHLLNRRRFREEPWAAMRFLLAAVRKNQRRVRVEQWLLLAVRTLVVLAVVLAMAKPFLERLGAAALLPGQRTHWVLVLDGSMSMARSLAGTSRFENAKSVAVQLARSARQGDGVSLVVMGNPPRAVVGAPSFNRDVVVEEINGLTPTDGLADLPATFTKLEEVMAASDIPRKHLVFLSDLQRSSWDQEGREVGEGLKSALAAVANRKARSSIIDLGSGSDTNRGITDLSVTPAVVTTAAPVTILARVQAFGASAGGEARVRLSIDGRQESESVCTLTAGEASTVVFLHEFATPGDHLLQVQIEPDDLKPDDERRLVVPVRQALKVLLVDGDPDPDPLRSETGFLQQALSPETDDGTPVSPLQCDVITDAQLSSRDLTAYDAVVIADMARISRAEASALDSYLELGGGVIVFTGDSVVPESYQRIGPDSEQPLLPVEVSDFVGDPARKEKPFEFDPLGFAHPIVAAFSGASPKVTASLTGVTTRRYSQLTVPAGSSARVALAFSSGDPAVVEAVRGRGRVIVVATSADASWTSWPLHQSYAPVMQEIVLQAAQGRSQDRNVEVGRPIIEPVAHSAIGQAATVLRPDSKTSPATVVEEGEIGILRFEGTDLSGTYAVSVGPPVPSETLFAANPNASESDPTKLDAASLRAAIPGWDFAYESDWRPLITNAASVGHRGELHRPLLWGLLGLLLIESTLAWRFSHHLGRAQ